MKNFWRYVEARLDNEVRDFAYRFYVTESLRGIPQQKFLTVSYDEILNPKNEDVDEIVASVLEGTGIILE